MAQNLIVTDSIYVSILISYNAYKIYVDASNDRLCAIATIVQVASE